MMRSLAAILAVGLLLGADDAKKTDKDRIQGDWVAESWEMDGKKLPADELKNVTMKVEGNEWTVKFGDHFITGIHKLDESKSPKFFESTVSDEGSGNILGIYDVNGDTWKYCWARAGTDRPKEFKANAEAGHNLIVWRRVKK
jgi:uncharacterized protein (TIGR03067 family)